MPKPVQGTRVYALRSADNDSVELLGFGTYVGDETPPDEVGGFNLGFENPKIELDDGRIVWGCECWWADYAGWDTFLAGRTIVNV